MSGGRVTNFPEREFDGSCLQQLRPRRRRRRRGGVLEPADYRAGVPPTLRAKEPLMKARRKPNGRARARTQEEKGEAYDALDAAPRPSMSTEFLDVAAQQQLVEQAGELGFPNNRSRRCT